MVPSVPTYTLYLQVEMQQNELRSLRGFMKSVMDSKQSYESVLVYRFSRVSTSHLPDTHTNRQGVGFRQQAIHGRAWMLLLEDEYSCSTMVQHAPDPEPDLTLDRLKMVSCNFLKSLISASFSCIAFSFLPKAASWDLLKARNC